MKKILLLLLLCSPAYSQEYLRHFGYSKDPLMAGYFLTVAGATLQHTVNLSLNPFIYENDGPRTGGGIQLRKPVYRIPPDTEHSYQGQISLLDLSLGLRFTKQNIRDFRWKGILLDFERNILGSNGVICGSLNDPLQPIPPPRPRFFANYGGTLLSHDRMGMLERHTKWIEGRGGLGFSYPRSYFSFIEPMLQIAAGLGNGESGNVYFSSMQPFGFSGFEWALKGNVRFRTKRFFLVADAEDRRFASAQKPGLRKYGAMLIFTGNKSNYGLGCDDSGIEAFIRYERQDWLLGDLRQTLDIWQTGLQVAL